MTRAEEVTYSIDGREMVGLLCLPHGEGRSPAALVAHEAPGLGAHTRDVATRLAELGYVAFAIDYQGDGRALTDLEEVMRAVGAWHTDPAPLRRRIGAAFDLLAGRGEVDGDRIVGMGYCFGGTALLEFARTGADLKAVVGFHAGLAVARPDEAASIRGRLLMLQAGLDPIVPPEHRHAFEAEMTAAGVDWRMTVFGRARHSFSNPAVDALGIEGVAYDATADAASWRMALDFLDEVVGRPSPRRTEQPIGRPTAQ